MLFRSMSVAFSPDGQNIVSGSFDHTVRVWDAKTGDVSAGPFKEQPGLVFSVAFSPDGQQIVSGSSDRTVRVWDAKTGEGSAWPFEGHTGPVMSVAFSPDGQKIVSGSFDHTVRVWDAITGQATPKPFAGHTSPVLSGAFSPDDHAVQVKDVPAAFLLDAALSTGSFKHANQEADFTGIYDSKLVNGWMQRKDSELLLWLPPYYRRGLWGPNVKMVIGTHTTKLCFTQFVHGTSWTHCYNNLT